MNCNYNRKKNYESSKRAKEKAKHKRKLLKRKLVEFMGGKCYVCKQVFHPCAFDFHHLDSSNKEEPIARMMIRVNQEDRILEELKNCIMVCSNCHRIIHFGGD